MSGFYKMDPAAWDFGTAELSLEEEAAYLRIVNAIHKHDGPVPNMDRVLAGLFRTSVRKARSLVDALVKAGKLVIEDGKIWNERARLDLVDRGFTSVSRAESGAKGGRKRAENQALRHNSQSVRDHFTTISTPETFTNLQRTDNEAEVKLLKDNDLFQANASSRIEENRIDKEREANASPKNAGLDQFEAFWQAYPAKGRIGKKAAMAKFLAAVKSGVRADHIIKAARAYCGTENVQRGYAKHAITWLNQGCWDDDAVKASVEANFWTGPVLT